MGPADVPLLPLASAIHREVWKGYPECKFLEAHDLALVVVSRPMGRP